MAWHWHGHVMYLSTKTTNCSAGYVIATTLAHAHDPVAIASANQDPPRAKAARKVAEVLTYLTCARTAAPHRTRPYYGYKGPNKSNIGCLFPSESLSGSSQGTNDYMYTRRLN